MRSQAEIKADFVSMKEATFWIPRTGHTKDKEIEVFEAASSRLMVDLDVDESIKRLFDTREGFIEYLEGLAKDSVADAAPIYLRCRL